jgi:hypothetical protein
MLWKVQVWSSDPYQTTRRLKSAWWLTFSSLTDESRLINYMARLSLQPTVGFSFRSDIAMRVGRSKHRLQWEPEETLTFVVHKIRQVMLQFQRLHSFIHSFARSIAENCRELCVGGSQPVRNAFRRATSSWFTPSGSM